MINLRRQTYRTRKCKSTGGYFNKLVQASSLTGDGLQCIPVDVMVSIISAWVWQARRNAILTGMPLTNSSSCTTSELSNLLTSCLTAVKNMLSSTVKGYMIDPVKIYFCLL